MINKKAFLSTLIIILCLIYITGCTDTHNLNKPDAYDDNNFSQQEMHSNGDFSNEFAIIDVLTHNDGLAWVNYYNTEGVEKFALVDQKGNELFTIPENNIKNPKYIKASEKGLSCYAYYVGEERVHNLVNSKGEVVASSTNGEFDSIVGCGLEYALVYKHEAGLYSSEQMIATLDQNGNIVHDYIPFMSPPSMNADKPLARYLGDGLFLLELSIPDNWMYYDCVGGNATYFMTSSNIEYSGSDLFVWDESKIAEIYKYTDLNDLGKVELYSGDHKIAKDGTFYELEDIEYDYFSQGYFVKKDGWDYKIYDVYKNREFKIESPIDDETHLTFKDDYIYISMTGKDYQPYFTLADNDGNILYEPICGVGYTSEGYVICEDKENESLCYLLDPSGNRIADLKASDVTDFENGVAICTDPETGKKRLMDINGNILFETIKLK